MDWSNNDQLMIDFFRMEDIANYLALKKEYAKLKKENERLKEENKIIPNDAKLVSKNIGCEVVIEYNQDLPKKSIEMIVKEKYCKALFKNLEVYKVETLTPILSEKNIREKYHVIIPKRQIDFKEDVY